MKPTPDRSLWPSSVRSMLYGYDAHYLGSWPVALPQTDDPNDLAGKRPGPGLLKAIRDKHLPDYQVATGGHRGYVLTTVVWKQVAHEFFTLTRRVHEPEGNVPGEGFIQGTIRFTPGGPRHSWDRDDADLELWLEEVKARCVTDLTPSSKEEAA